ncbi:MAG: hypothetical protein LBT88_02690 [Oscillospiraceae bacterium]|jgi:hypothetical protein|nr:hypothetical protein [Oscillospiraceae bacterium]
MKKLKIVIIISILVGLPVMSFFISKAVLINSPRQEIQPTGIRKTDKIISSGLLVEKDVTQLIAEADVIVYGTIYDNGDPIKIRSVASVRAAADGEDVSGSFSVFTDYYIDPEIILQNRRPEYDISNVPIRLEGGIIDGLEVIAELEPPFEIGNKYLLFLKYPGIGGGYITNETQFYIAGAVQGRYEETEGDPILRTYFGDREITLEELVKQVEEFEASGEPVKTQWEEFLENQNHNIETGFITQEEYDRFIEEAQMYAEIIE